MRSEGPTAADLERFSRDAEPAASAAAYHAFADGALEPQKFGLDPEPKAWRVDAERAALRKSPAHKELHAARGARARRHHGPPEAVSMVPPLFLACRPGDRVLDTCAAPGSKTSQLIEAVFRPGREV